MFRTFAVLLVLSNLFCAAAQCVSGEESSTLTIPAFPGAEGFGAFATGGRGGQVYLVETLDDYDSENGETPIPGTLRFAVEAEGPRIVVFRVSGTIDLKNHLNLRNDHITIAGQTAPGDGICLKSYAMYITASEVIIRYVRFRIGDEKDIACDSVNGKRLSNLIMDHCSISWGMDECATFARNSNTTLQWCLVSESLRLSHHHKGAHGYGGGWGGVGASFHHNLLAHHSSRNPRMCDPGVVDYRNNVIYNWGFNTAYGGENGKFNLIANYYKAGPATEPEKRARIADPYEGASLYVEDN